MWGRLTVPSRSLHASRDRSRDYRIGLKGYTLGRKVYPLDSEANDDPLVPDM